MENEKLSKLLEELAACKSSNELYERAKEMKVDLTREEAESYFNKLSIKEGELSDDELDNVSGGACKSGYISASIDGKYYRKVNDRKDCCNKFICRCCGGSRGNHIGVGPNDHEDSCLFCQFSAGHQLVGSFCTLDYITKR